MQLTIEIPDELAQGLCHDSREVSELIEAGLRFRDWVGASTVANEVIEFLAGGPKPADIIAFHPSPAAMTHVRELLDENRSGDLTASQKAELDEMALLDHLITLVKARAFKQAKAA
jgi:hypothetical protein